MEFKHKDKIAKGERRANTFTIIYLKEYEKIKLKSEKVKVDLIKPSTENILVVIELMPIVELISLINEEKQISVLKIFSPKFLIDKVIFEEMSKICSTIK